MIKIMRIKAIFSLLVIAMGTLACTSTNVQYTVNGVNAPEDGVVVYLVDELTSTPIDSAIVAGGAFKMKGKAAKDAYLTVKTERDDCAFMLINDGEPVVLNYADSTVAGSALNSKLAECEKARAEAYAEYLAMADALDEAYYALPEEEQDAGVEEYNSHHRALKDKDDQSFFEMIEENKHSLIPVAFMETYRIKAGADSYNEFLSSDVPFAKHPYVLEVKRRYDEFEAQAEARRKEIEEKKQAVIDQKFLDLEEADPDGNLHKLSEYAGRGNWVLVDFWASWCAPCKKEMPNVVAAYKKYHARGLEIVGLSFDDEKEPWVEAIAKWEMPWVHLSDLKFIHSVASDVYSVNSIPDNLLIDPEGTVVARNLLGDALNAKLAEIFP